MTDFLEALSKPGPPSTVDELAAKLYGTSDSAWRDRACLRGGDCALMCDAATTRQNHSLGVTMNSFASAYGANAGGVVFATTHWSVVLTAQGQSTAADAALEALCRTYWMPLYAFIRREGSPVEEAQDLTQEFFARWLERRDFDAVRREKGRLRSYLLVSLKHFLANERDRARTMKRGSGAQPISLDEILAHQRFDLEPVEALTADQIYERQWATAVLDQVLAGLDHEYRDSGRGLLFDRLKVLLMDEPGHPSQAEIGQELGMTENAVKQAFHRLRLRYREVLREQIAHTVATPAEVEDELRHLIAVLRT